MSDVFSRCVGMPADSGPWSYEDPRWAELHAAIIMTPGSGNVFADLGLPDAAGLLAAADARLAAADCRCTNGHVCRHNNACPRIRCGSLER